MIQVPTVTLRTGQEIPQVGFGTYKVVDGAAGIVSSAIQIGYRHIDTAQMYHNEPEVGQGWRESGVPREELFLTSKLDNPNHLAEDARRSFEQTLVDLQTEYVDLFLIHWPLPMYYGGDFGATWKVLEEFHADGRARSIGVSNFEIHHLEQLFETAQVLPAVNQIESHPYFPQQQLHDFNLEHGIATEAWSPLGRGGVTDNLTLIEIGKRYGKTAAQVALRWGVQRGDIVLPKASTPQRQAENLNIFDFALNDDEMELIFSLDRGEEGRTGKHPDVMDRL